MQVVHQPALLDGQDLIEGTRDVETDGWGVLHQRFVLQLFTGEPTLVRTAEIEFVAIFLGLHTA